MLSREFLESVGWVWDDTIQMYRWGGAPGAYENTTYDPATDTVYRHDPQPQPVNYAPSDFNNYHNFDLVSRNDVGGLTGSMPHPLGPENPAAKPYVPPPDPTKPVVTPAGSKPPSPLVPPKPPIPGGDLGAAQTPGDLGELVNVDGYWRLKGGTGVKQTPGDLGELAGTTRLGGTGIGGKPVPGEANDAYLGFGWRNEQGPAAAWRRYLSGSGKSPQYGTQAEGWMNARGKQLSEIAPAFAYGFDKEQGGAGRDFSDFYGKAMGEQGIPAFDDVHAVAGHVNDLFSDEALKGQMKGLTAEQAEKAGMFAKGGTLAGRQADVGLLGKYGGTEGLDDQAALVESNLALRSNPFWHQALNRQLERQFNMQQATNPNETWLSYALKMGLI